MCSQQRSAASCSGFSWPLPAKWVSSETSRWSEDITYVVRPGGTSWRSTPLSRPGPGPAPGPYIVVPRGSVDVHRQGEERLAADPARGAVDRRLSRSTIDRQPKRPSRPRSRTRRRPSGSSAHTRGACHIDPARARSGGRISTAVIWRPSSPHGARVLANAGARVLRCRIPGRDRWTSRPCFKTRTPTSSTPWETLLACSSGARHAPERAHVASPLSHVKQIRATARSISRTAPRGSIPVAQAREMAATLEREPACLTSSFCLNCRSRPEFRGERSWGSNPPSPSSPSGSRPGGAPRPVPRRRRVL